MHIDKIVFNSSFGLESLMYDFMFCRKIDNLSQTRSSLEQTKLDMEQKIRNLEYNLSEEAEMRKNAETLLGKTKDQLTRKEEQFTR